MPEIQPYALQLQQISATMNSLKNQIKPNCKKSCRTDWPVCKNWCILMSEVHLDNYMSEFSITIHVNTMGLVRSMSHTHRWGDCNCSCDSVFISEAEPKLLTAAPCVNEFPERSIEFPEVFVQRLKPGLTACFQGQYTDEGRLALKYRRRLDKVPTDPRLMRCFFESQSMMNIWHYWVFCFSPK